MTSTFVDIRAMINSPVKVAQATAATRDRSRAAVRCFEKGTRILVRGYETEREHPRIVVRSWICDVGGSVVELDRPVNGMSKVSADRVRRAPA